jgi:hypothetical protein
MQLFILAVLVLNGVYSFFAGISALNTTPPSAMQGVISAVHLLSFAVSVGFIGVILSLSEEDTRPGLQESLWDKILRALGFEER